MNLHIWSSLGQVASAALATLVVYTVGLAAVRLAGRRTTARISAFDALVTIALGTTLASTALPAAPAISDGVAVLATLLALQVAIGFLRQRSALVRRLTDFDPRVVIRDGQLEHPTRIGTAQLTVEEVVAELRNQGVGSMHGVALMVLEPSGRFSVRTVADEVVGEATAGGATGEQEAERDLWSI